MASKGDIIKEDIQPKLHSSWTTIPFKDSLDKTGKFTKLKSKEYFDEGDFPVIDQGEKMISGYIDDPDLLYKGHIPVTIFGDHTRVVKFINFKFAAGADGTKILNPKKGINDKFFYYYIKSLNIPSFGYSRHFKVFEYLDFPLPLIQEQKRIVEKLDIIFDLIRKIEERAFSLVKMRDSLIQSCLIDFENEKYYDSNHLAEYLEEETERIGDNWEGKFKVGVSAKKGIIKLATGQKKSFEKYKIVKPGDFVYNAMRVNIGSIAHYTGSEIAITSPDYIVFRVTKLLSPNLLFGFLKSEIGLNQIKVNTKGSVRSRLYFKNLINIKCPIAPANIQEEAEKLLNWFNSFCSKLNKNSIVDIEKLEQSVLIKAFKGELVIHDQNYKSANKVMKRIQNEKGEKP